MNVHGVFHDMVTGIDIDVLATGSSGASAFDAPP